MRHPNETRAAILSCCIMFGLLMLMILGTGCASIFATTKCRYMNIKECWPHKPCEERTVRYCREE